mmetsp:Transcript_108416/g.317180  ORF Transcript_108416/g.317180 Transcript_108416/m.317180 type:complete len:304 (-) Transcript_108416:120-1031(-)
MSATDAPQRRGGNGGRDKANQENHDNSFKKNANISMTNQGSEGQPNTGEDEDRLYQCAECGKAADLGAIDEEDGQWYCKGCWEALLGGDEKGGDEADGASSPDDSGKDAGYQGPVDEDSEGVAFVLSDGAAGFCISQEGLKLLRSRGKDYSADTGGTGVPRMDADLVALVREHPSRMAGDGTSLVVRRIPREAYDAGAYRIHDLEGKEILAIDPDAYCEQASALRELRSRAEEQDREWPALAKLLASLHHVLYQGDHSDEERIRRLRKLAPAGALQATARPAESLMALAESADKLMGSSAGGS